MPGLAKSIQQHSGTKTIVPALKGGQQLRIPSKNKSKVLGLRSEEQHPHIRTQYTGFESEQPPPPQHQKKKAKNYLIIERGEVNWG